MKIYTVSGTRPDYIRLMPTIRKLDKYFDHTLVWANQNFTASLSTQFFEEFGRVPDHIIPNEGVHGSQYIGQALVHLESLYRKGKPDCVLVLGDTNASFTAVYAAKRCGIPVFHVEAGNRCYSEDTEVFTNQGWKFFKDIKGTELILTRRANGITEWSKIIEKQVYEHNGLMYHLKHPKHNNLDLLITPDHRLCLLPKKGKLRYIWKTVQELKKTKYYIPKDLIWQGVFNNKYTKKYLILLGWFLSEGWASKTQVRIYQKKNSKYWQEIKKIIEKNGFNPKESHHSWNINDKKLASEFIKFGKHYQKYIPNEIKGLPSDYLKCLLNALIKGDGTKNYNAWRYYTTSKLLANDVQEIAYKCGFTSEISILNPRTKNNKIQYIVSISPAKSAKGISTQLSDKNPDWIKKVHYVGKVYDLTVEKNHTLWVRRNNSCVWSSNCYDPDRVPEEINRYMIDAISDWHLCYTQRAREQLIAEGKPLDHIIVVGNPIIEAINDTPLGSIVNPIEGYYLCTIHRKENIEDLERLSMILANLNGLDRTVRISNHPSFESKYNMLSDDFKKTLNNLEFFTPCNFKDFLELEQAATCVITDSGTVPEECYAFGTPCVLLRYSTERPELLEANAMLLCDDPNNLEAAVRLAVGEMHSDIKIPEYHGEASGNIVKLLMRWNDGNKHEC